MTDPVLDAFRRREYPDVPEVHFDSASYGLLPRVTVDAVTSLTARRNRPGGIPDPEPGAALRRARGAAARLLGADPSEISLVPNTTFGLHIGVALVAAGPPGVVVVSEGEFPANVLPWLALRDRGFEVRVLPLAGDVPDEAGLMREARSSEVRAVSVSAVQYASGFRVDLERLGRACGEGGTLLVVDAIQALGTVPLAPAELGIDVLATGAQKWLLGPWGAGFAWVAPRHRTRILPPVVSWLSVEGGGAYSTLDGYALDFLDDGRRFEPATLGIQDYLGMAESLEALLELGVDRIRAHQQRVQGRLAAWARGRGVKIVGPAAPEARAGILSLALEDAPGAQRALAGAGIRVAVREGWLRFAPHLYVGEAEAERAVAVLDGVVGGG